jgi:hypothetical protein
MLSPEMAFDLPLFRTIEPKIQEYIKSIGFEKESWTVQLDLTGDRSIYFQYTFQGNLIKMRGVVYPPKPPAALPKVSKEEQEEKDAKAALEKAIDATLFDENRMKKMDRIRGLPFDELILRNGCSERADKVLDECYDAVIKLAFNMASKVRGYCNIINVSDMNEEEVHMIINHLHALNPEMIPFVFVGWADKNCCIYFTYMQLNHENRKKRIRDMQSLLDEQRDEKIAKIQAFE